LTEFILTCLGTGSASPRPDRFPASQVIKFNSNYYLIDCGEGTQMQLKKYKIPIQKINRVFISHMHADHYLGLPGLIFTIEMLGKVGEFHIHGPKELKHWLEFTCNMNKKFGKLKLIFHETEMAYTKIFETKRLEIYTVPLDHNIHCTGFIFKERELLRKLKPNMLEAYEIPNHQRNSIKEGADFITKEGVTIKNKSLTLPAPEPRSYAYISDTRLSECYTGFLKGLNLIYHEATFLDNEKARAVKTYHSTAKEVAKMAKDYDIAQVLLGHFSARYGNLDDFIIETKDSHSDTKLARDGMIVKIEYYG
jgi:ribonuclease Z